MCVAAERSGLKGGTNLHKRERERERESERASKRQRGGEREGERGFNDCSLDQSRLVWCRGSNENQKTLHQRERERARARERDNDRDRREMVTESNSSAWLWAHNPSTYILTLILPGAKGSSQDSASEDGCLISLNSRLKGLSRTCIEGTAEEDGFRHLLQSLRQTGVKGLVSITPATVSQQTLNCVQ